MKARVLVIGVALAILAGISVPAPAAAQGDLKLAVVDARRALISSNEGREAEKKLKKMMDRKKKEIEPMEAQLRREEEEFESQKYVLTNRASEERQLELIKQKRDLERHMREAQDDLELEQRKLMQPMVEKVEKALGQLGKEMGFTVILEKSSPGVLYTAETLDITDLLIQRLNK